MSNILEYTLSLNDLMSAKLQKIGINNDMMLEKFSKLEVQQKAVSKGFDKMGTSVHTLRKKINLLQQERDLLPIGSLKAIRKYNSEINKLERKVTKLQTLNGSKVKTWFKDALNGLPSVMTNPLVLIGAGVGASIKKGMEADMQKANILTLVRGNAEKAKKLYTDISKYGIKTPYEKQDIVEAQKTMMSFGLDSEFAFSKLKNIGDIALGDAQKMKSLSLAFSQATSAGKLQGQDWLQMINAGFNPLQVISERTGESMKSLKDRMGKGGISAKELAQAFEWATDKQGQFYNGAEKASQTLGGKMSNLMDSLTELALKVYDVVSPIITPLVELAISLFTTIGDGLGWFINKIKDGSPWVIGITAVIGAFTLALIAHNTYTSVAAFFQKKLTWAVLKTNMAFLANPITWIVAGVILLIASITYLIYKIDGWGKAWKHTVNGAKFIFKAWVSSVKAYFGTLVNGIMIGINKIMVGWYKFKNAVGIGDKNANNAIIQKISNDTEQRKKQISKSWSKVKENALKAKEEFVKAGQSLKWRSDKSLSGVKKTLMGKLGLSTPSNKGVTGNKNNRLNELGKKTSENIITGGRRATHINVSIGNLGTDTKVYVSSVKEGIDDLGRRVQEELLRAVNSINQMQTA